MIHDVVKPSDLDWLKTRQDKRGIIPDNLHSALQQRMESESYRQGG